MALAGCRGRLLGNEVDWRTAFDRLASSRESRYRNGSRSAHERLGLECGGHGDVWAVFKQIARLTIENFTNLAKRIEADPADLTGLEKRHVLLGDADPLRELLGAHLALGQHH